MEARCRIQLPLTDTMKRHLNKHYLLWPGASYNSKQERGLGKGHLQLASTSLNFTILYSVFNKFGVRMVK